MATLSIDKFLNIFRKNVNVEDSNEYVELEVEQGEKPMPKLYVKYYKLVKFEEAGAILNDIRSGYVLSFIKMKELREKGGIEELKRTISKLKRSADASDAQIVGVDEDYIIIVPNFVKVEKGEVLGQSQQTQQ
ncbi:cell division protein SepF [Candidatus Parvarchaeota archaeon]|nr:cell division protein SepF [Candidatus Parvarchaeota archaeon]